MPHARGKPRLYADDVKLFSQPFDIRPDGMMHAPDRPGLGFPARADALERFGHVDDPEA